MYLKEIRTSGFKSFADKITINLTSGISGIVGPNGSGKSNIVDAIRWVLGEQSVKQLRGEGAMSDVIFSGSKSRKAANLASVTLIFDNTDKYLPIDYSEVQIKRCIYKTGENEYYLNNEKCRLKDIQDLLVDTGVNKESFNIISQGDIGAILSNKPEDRRIIFESAANVLKYRKRKDEALRKLDRTHDNMTRINDIILEIESNLKPLEKQSDDAKKYLENKEKLDSIEVSLIVSEVESMNTEYQENKLKVSNLTNELTLMETDNSTFSANSQKLKLEQTKNNEELFEMQNKLNAITKEAEELKGKKNLITERQKYNASDTKVHDNLVNIKENILRKENEIFASNNNISMIKRKLDEVNLTYNDIIFKFNKLKEVHDALENDMLTQNRLENETKYKIEMLKTSIENNSSLPYAVKCVLDNPKLTGIHGTIASLIEVDDLYATSISTALASASSYIVTTDELAAKDAVNYLKINKFGRATFFPINIIKEGFIDNETLRILRLENDFIDVASNLVRYESTYDRIIKNRLGTTIIVKDLDSANSIARKISYRYKVVSLDGELVHTGGAITGGAIKNQTNIITQKHDLNYNRELLRKLQEKRKEKEEKINIEDNKYKVYDNLKNKTLDEKTKLEASYNYELLKKSSLEKELDNLKEEVNNIKGLINNTLSKEEEKIVEEFYEKERQRQSLELNVNNIKAIINSNNETIEEMEKESRLNNSLYYKKKDELKDLEIKVNRLDVMLDNLLNTLTEDYSITYEKAKENYFLDMDKKEARQIVDKCKAEIKRLGEVNLGAIEEYERVKTRHEFLTNQRNDLEKAEDTILEIIKELDDIMKEKFINTFNEIKEKFKEVFKKLFGGGNAELSLTDPDDILKTGIDIKALPPGKTLKHISLLSGGEKTLTAIALLFAILEVRPVPFCVLDEVEAALDEVNVDNFGKFLNEFKKKTQFIVITHKKKTMEYADCLYGITMQESGVSKLVSVKLEDIDNKNNINGGN